MFTKLTSILLLAASLASALPTPSTTPTAYIQDADLLEPYPTFKARYVAWNCKNLHGTAFYDSCCHPVLKDELLSALPTLCSNPPSVASTTTETVYVTITDGPEPTSSAKVVAAAASSDDECADDETDTADDAGDDDCTDDSDDGSVEVDDGEDCPDGTVESTDGADNAAADPTTTTKASTSTTTKKPTTTTTKASTTTAAAAAQGGSGKTYSGQATYFLQNGGYGACGDKNKDSDLGAAINFHLYGNDSKKSSWCGKTLAVTNPKNKKTINLKVWDDCPSCPGGGDLDLSEGAFKALMDTSLGEGVFKITWQEV